MKKTLKNIICGLITAITICSSCFLGGCGSENTGGYTHGWIYPEEIQSVYVEMFNSSSFRRGYEYILTDAICKYLESSTPYKIVSNRDAADAVLYGQLTIVTGVVTSDRYTGTPLENDSIAEVTFSWKNLKTGKLMLQDVKVTAATSYSSNLGQTFDYAIRQAMNKAAIRVVEKMEKPW